MSSTFRRFSAAAVAACFVATLSGAASTPVLGMSDTDLQPRIVHGLPTTTAQNPWQAHLIVNGQYLCGGELISPRVVLTAAHCMSIAADPQSLQVTLGRDETARGGIAMPVAALITSPTYSPRTPRGDWGLAILSVDAPEQFTPLKIAGDNENALWSPGRDATVSGYGLTSENGRLSKMLRVAGISILPNRSCSSATAYGSHFDKQTMLCAGDPQSRKDSCSGDSGGPLVVLADDGTPRLAGIVSFGKGCAEEGFPGVYTRIAGWGPSSLLAQALQGLPETAGYPYFGSGGACVSSTDAAAAAERRLAHRRDHLRAGQQTVRHALRKARRADRNHRAHPTSRTAHDADRAHHTLRDAKAAVRAYKRQLAVARQHAHHAAKEAHTACH